MPVFQPPAIDTLAILPLVIVTITAMVVLIVGLFTRHEQSAILGAIGLIGVGLAVVATVALWGQGRTAFGGTIVADNFFVFFGVVSLAIVALTLILSAEFVTREEFLSLIHI